MFLFQISNTTTLFLLFLVGPTFLFKNDIKNYDLLGTHTYGGISLTAPFFQAFN
jgi:hypothetical protein